MTQEHARGSEVHDPTRHDERCCPELDPRAVLLGCLPKHLTFLDDKEKKDRERESKRDRERAHLSKPFGSDFLHEDLWSSFLEAHGVRVVLHLVLAVSIRVSI